MSSLSEKVDATSELKIIYINCARTEYKPFSIMKCQLTVHFQFDGKEILLCYFHINTRKKRRFQTGKDSSQPRGYTHTKKVLGETRIFSLPRKRGNSVPGLVSITKENSRPAKQE